MKLDNEIKVKDQWLKSEAFKTLLAQKPCKTNYCNTNLNWLLFSFSEPFPQRQVKKHNLHFDLVDKAKAQYKEELGPIPITKINSVCSMASPEPSPNPEVI